MADFRVGGVEYVVDVSTAALVEAGRKVAAFTNSAQKEFKASEVAAKAFSATMTRVGAAVKTALQPRVMAQTAAAIGALASSLTVAATQMAKASREMAQLAELSGLTKNNFEALSFATSQYGITAEKIADISKDISDKLGDFIAAGSGAFQDFADVMKLNEDQARATALEFSRMSGRDVLIEMVTQMEDAGASAAEMTFALESLGNDSAKLLPILRNGGHELRELENRFLETTQALRLTAQEEKNLAKLAVSFDLLTEVMTKAFTKLAGTFGPQLSEILEDIADATVLAMNFWKEAAGIETADADKNFLQLQDEYAKTATIIRGLEDDLKNAQSGSAFSDMLGDTAESVQKELDAANARLKELEDLITGVNNAVREANKAKVESALNPFAGLAGDAKGDLVKSIMGDGKDFTRAVADIKQALNIRNELQYEANSEQLIANETARQAELSSLQAAFDKKLESIKKYNKNESELIKEQAAERAGFVEKKATKDELEALDKRHASQIEQVREFNAQILTMTEEFNKLKLAVNEKYDRNLVDLEAETWQQVQDEYDKGIADFLDNVRKHNEAEKAEAKKHYDKLVDIADGTTGLTKEQVLERNYKEQMQMLKEAHEATLIEEQEFNDRMLELARQYNEEKAELQKGDGSAERAARQAQQERDRLESAASGLGFTPLEQLEERQARELEVLREAQEAGIESKKSYEERLTELQRQHSEQREEMLKQEARNQSMISSSMQDTLSMFGGLFGELASAAKEGGKESFTAYKMMASAQATISALLAANKALAELGPIAGPVAAGVIGGIAMANVVKINSMSYSGRRYGGEVSAGGTYQVNENGVPEMVTTGGNQYLTMGSTGGKVTPLDKVGMGINLNIINQASDVVSVTKETGPDGEFVRIAKIEAEKAAKGMYNNIANEFQSGNGRIVRAATANTNMKQKAYT